MNDKIEILKTKDISDFPNHPFSIDNNFNYRELKNSIIENGILVPVTVRKKDNGKFKVLSGHRRK